MTNYTPLMQVAEQVLAKSANRRDYSTRLGDFVEGFQTVTEVNSPEGILTLTPHGFQQLAKDRFGLPPAIFAHKGVSSETKLQILRDMVHNGFGDDVVKVRVAGSQVEAIVSNDYSFFDNADLVTALLQLQNQNLLPKDTQVMKHNLSPDGRDLHMRLVAPDEWDFTLGENGNSKQFHGNLVISNNEIAMGSFAAQVAITRTACLNSTIGQSLFKVEHRFADRGDFLNQLGNAVKHINGYSNEMGDNMRKFQHVNVDAPLLIFDRIGSELGIPKYALNSAKTYWENEGSQNSLYDVVQAIAAGARDVTVAEGRRRPSWGTRTLIEQAVWGIATELQQVVTDGGTVEAWYLQGDNALKYRIMKIIEGYKSYAPIVEEILEQVERVEVSE